MSAIQQAVILVGGKGTRLGPLTATKPKPLLPVLEERGVLDLLIENTARFGYRRILLLAGYLGEQFVPRYHGRSIRGATVSVVQEPEPGGTAGALAYAAEHLDESFILMNGDSIFDVNLRALELELHDDVVGLLALRHVDDAARFGTVTLEGAHVTRFLEKARKREAALINGGIYVLRRTVLDYVCKSPCSIESDVFPALAARRLLAGIVQSGYFIDIGLPETFARAREELAAWQTRPIAFLDRDGVLNRDLGWPHLPSDIFLIEGAREAVRLLNELGFYVVVVSNQAGVARGLYDEAQVGVFNLALSERLFEAGAHVDAFYYCPYHPDASVAAYKQDSPMRKPKPGMLLKAFAEWPGQRAGSFLIGDKISDIEAAAAAGVPGHLFCGGALSEFVEALPEVAAQARRLGSSHSA